VNGLETPSISVAICTHNRWRDVERCLEALAPQAREEGLPVFVVDSGSDAADAEHLRRTALAFGTRYLRVNAKGVSRARNVAAGVAEGDWIVYLDDDAVPDPTWAANLKAVLSAQPPSVAIVGGKIRPRLPPGAGGVRLTARWKILLSCTDAEGQGEVPKAFNICGANLAVRRSDLLAVGGFPEHLGRVGGRLISGEESYLIERVQEERKQTRYDSRFAVDHVIPEERLTVAWVARRAFWEGISRVRIYAELGRTTPPDLGRAKLTISLPILSLCSLFSVDYKIRRNLAAGALLARCASVWT